MPGRPKPWWMRWETLAVLALVLYPPICGMFGPNFGRDLGNHLSTLFIWAILALGLNVAAGYTGLLQLGIAAFFGIGAYITGIATVDSYPFQVGFAAALVFSTVGAAVCGLVLGAPTLRLRGDYLAIVTLGFGEVVKVTLRNLEQITKGTKGLNPIPPPEMPQWLVFVLSKLDISDKWGSDYRLFYYLTLLVLAGVVVLLWNLEKSRLGRAWVALREDQLAATCMGISAPRVKMAAFAVSSGLAGLAGCLFATKNGGTADPNNYDFARSIIMLCCVILGGLGSIRGTILGVFLLIGVDIIVLPKFDEWMQTSGLTESAFAWAQGISSDGSTFPETVRRLLTFNNWRLIFFGLALVLMMRFRPEGLLPSSRIQQELHHR